MTVKELKEYLDNFDNNLKVCINDSDNGINILEFNDLNIRNIKVTDKFKKYLLIG